MKFSTTKYLFFYQHCGIIIWFLLYIFLNISNEIFLNGIGLRKNSISIIVIETSHSKFSWVTLHKESKISLTYRMWFFEKGNTFGFWFYQKYILYNNTSFHSFFVVSKHEDIAVYLHLQITKPNRRFIEMAVPNIAWKTILFLKYPIWIGNFKAEGVVWKNLHFKM